MAAGLGFKTFTTGEVLTAADVNGYLMQGVLVFASEAARNAAITSPQEGQFAFTKDNNSTWYYDGAAWVASGASGDVTGVTAGTGITVTNPTGPVPTVTNDMATTITAAGDIVVGTGSGTYDNLPIGTTAQVLTADTTVSPYKVKWATLAASGATYSGCMLTNSANIGISNNSQTTLTWDTEEIDVDGYHSTATNTGRITIPTGKTGKFLISFQLRYSPNATGRRIGYIFKNGTTELWSAQVNGTATNDTVFTGTYVISLAATDYLECRTYQNSGGALDVQGPAPYSYFSATYLGA